MKNYEVISHGKNVNMIREVGTKLIVKTLYDKHRAISICNKLNGGHGFNGTTPKFFIDRKEQL